MKTIPHPPLPQLHPNGTMICRHHHPPRQLDHTRRMRIVNRLRRPQRVNILMIHHLLPLVNTWMIHLPPPLVNTWMIHHPLHRPVNILMRMIHRRHPLQQMSTTTKAAVAVVRQVIIMMIAVARVDQIIVVAVDSYLFDHFHCLYAHPVSLILLLVLNVAVCMQPISQ